MKQGRINDFLSSGSGKIVKKGDEKIRHYFTLFLAVDLVKSWEKVVMRNTSILHLHSGSRHDEHLKNGGEKIRPYFTLNHH